MFTQMSVHCPLSSLTPPFLFAKDNEHVHTNIQVPNTYALETADLIFHWFHLFVFAHLKL